MKKITILLATALIATASFATGTYDTINANNISEVELNDILSIIKIYKADLIRLQKDRNSTIKKDEIGILEKNLENKEALVYPYIKKLIQDGEIDKAAQILFKLTDTKLKEDFIKQDKVRMHDAMLKAEKMEVAPIIRKFVFEDTSIADNFDSTYYLTGSLGGQYDTVLSGLQAGLNYKIKAVKGLRSGAFAEYHFNGANQIVFGANLEYNDFSSFIRYRLARADEVNNHNLDIYLKYGHKFDIQTKRQYLVTSKTVLSVTPSIGLLGTYSSPIDILKDDKEINVKQRFGGLVEGKVRVDYHPEKYDFYVEPVIKGIYNAQELKDGNKVFATFPFRAGLKLGIQRTFVYLVTVGADANLETDFSKDFTNGKARIFAKYEW